MPKAWNVHCPLRRTGLAASIIAVAALSVTVVSDSHNVGLGHAVTRDERLFLLEFAALLFIVQAIAYLIHRRRTLKSATDPLWSAPSSAKNHR